MLWLDIDGDKSSVANIERVKVTKYITFAFHKLADAPFYDTLFCPLSVIVLTVSCAHPSYSVFILLLSVFTAIYFTKVLISEM